jgi:AhpD family alkylhydroperoxidase
VPQPDHISVLPVPNPEALDEDLQELFALCTEKLGIVPNVLRAYSLRPQKLRNFVAMYNELMLAPSGLTKLEREMVAVVVSSANRCYYCLVAHGQAVRCLSGDPELGEMLVMNYRVAPLDPRLRQLARGMVGEFELICSDRLGRSQGRGRGGCADGCYEPSSCRVAFHNRVPLASEVEGLGDVR